MEYTNGDELHGESGKPVQSDPAGAIEAQKTMLPPPKPFYKHLWFWMLAVIAGVLLPFIVAGGSFVASDDDYTSNPEATLSSRSHSEPETPAVQPQATPLSESPKPKVSESPKPKVSKATDAPTPVDSSTSEKVAADTTEANTRQVVETFPVNSASEHERALNIARDYLDFTDFSAAGLYEQLTSQHGENFSAEAAQYAVDNVGADWKAEALEAARSYLDTSHFSYNGLYEQLSSKYGSQFTPEEARYAVDNVGADWKAEAVEAARSYRDTVQLSNEEIRNQLISEYGSYFSEEEADYGINNM